MTKAEIVTKITEETGIEKSNTQRVVEAFMEIVKNSVKSGEPVYLRGFGSFIKKTRKQKVGRNIKKRNSDCYSGTRHSGIQACQDFC